MDESNGDPDGGREYFDLFARVTYKLFGNSFLVVAGGAVGGLTLFLITVTVAWSLNAGIWAAFAGLIAIPVGYVLAARLVRVLIRRPVAGPR